MAKLTLSDLANLTNQSSAIARINNNNDLVETAMENTLSRDGTSPNNMEADLDMDSNRIYNLPLAVSGTEPVRQGEYAELVDQVADLAGGASAADALTILTSRSYTVGSTGDFATWAAAEAFLNARIIADGAVVTLTPQAETVTVSSGAIMTLTSSLSGKVRVEGAAPTAVTITGINGVTSTGAGNHSVEYNVSSTTGLAVGGFISIKEVTPYNGGLVSGLFESPYGRNIGTIASSSGTTVNVNGTCTGKITSGELVYAQGQMRVVDTVGASSFTTTAAFNPVLPTTVYWHIMPANTGTVSTTASTTLTGSSTDFLSTTSIGAIIVAAARGWRVTAVGGNTSLTTAQAWTLGASTPYFVWSPTKLHEGCWRITSIDTGNSRVTVRNYNRSTGSQVPPPAFGLTGATAYYYKTVIENTGGGDGFVIKGGGNLYINNVVLAGDNSSTSSVGVNLQGTDEDVAGGNVSFGPKVVLFGWGLGVNAGVGCSVFGDYLVISAGYRGAYVFDGGSLRIRSGVISGCLEYGLFQSQGKSVIDALIIAGCGRAGLYLGTGSNAHGDYHYVIGCGWYSTDYGVFVEGGAFVHGAPCFYLLNRYANCNIGRGSSNRGTGSINACSGGDGWAIDFGIAEIATSWTFGNQGYNVRNNGGLLKGNTSSYNGGHSGGVIGTNGSNNDLTQNCTILNCNGIGLQLQGRSTSSEADSAYIDDNGTYDVSVATGAEVNHTSAVGTPVYNQTANERGSADALIATTTYTERSGSFHVALSANQTGLTASADNKVNLDSETIDSEAWFASYKFTPQRAGRYFVTAKIKVATGGGITAQAKIFKNGVVALTGDYLEGASGTCQTGVSGIVSLNGSTDYIELYAALPAGVTQVDGAANAYTTYMTGYRISGV